ncbi:btk-binding protein-related [Anaeramoeba flamelloides]|uniref:Btk-binding protein-related n=1 Tax=Anaeramoeba flamelloides TaxID=1746091 RepID=A0AAV7Y2A2_9EUKA|nr:btk-binding protein-related [Anaeramoeba flamelloides]
MTEKPKQQIKKLTCSGASINSVDINLPQGFEVVEAGYGNSNCVFVGKDGSVYEYDATINNSKKLTITNGVKAACGFSHYILLTSDGMVYSKGSGNYLGLGSISNASVPTMIPYFKENNLKVVDITAGVSQSFFLTDNGDLYGCGTNNVKNLGIEDGQNKSVPTKLEGKKIKEIYCNNYAYGIWYKDENDEVWGFGEHVAQNKRNYSALEIFKGKQIIKAAPGYQKLLLLVRDEEGNNLVYYETSKGNPRLWPELTKENVIDAEFACHHCVMITKDGRVLGSGSTPNGYGVLNVPKRLPATKVWKIVCGAWNSLCFAVSSSNSLSLDMQIFSDKSNFADLQILDRKVHSGVLKWRTGKEGPDAIEILKTFSKKHIDSFLDWCYFSEAFETGPLQEVATAFKIEIDPKKPLNENLLQLYRNDDSKDFAILVKDEDDDYDDDDEDNEEGDEEQELVDIPVHKFILQARSGLFREMFSTIKDEKNQVQDFSGLGPDSMEVFIKYLYTDAIELTADDDPELVLKELELVPEYFQLNENNNFLEQIVELKKFHGVTETNN